VRFAGVVVPEDIRKAIVENPGGEKLVRLNRSLLEATYSSDNIARNSFLQSPRYRITDQGGGRLLSLCAFGLFLLGPVHRQLCVAPLQGPIHAGTVFHRQRV